MLSLAAGVVVAAPSPANAAVLSTPTSSTEIQFGAHPSGVTCTASGPTASPVSLPFGADGVPVTSTSSASHTFTDDSDPADVTLLSASTSSTVTATQSGGQLTDVAVQTSANVSATTQKAGQRCNAVVLARAQTSFDFDLVAPALVTISYDSHGVEGIIDTSHTAGSPDQDTITDLDGLGPHSSGSAQVLMPAGANNADLTLSGRSLYAPDTATTQSVGGSITLDLKFQVPGAASRAARGFGRSFLTLAGGRDCAAGTLGGTWSDKAGRGRHRRIDRATVYVNDARVTTLRRPTSQQLSTFAGLDPQQPAAVRVVLKMHGGGKQFVLADYLACS